MTVVAVITLWLGRLLFWSNVIGSPLVMVQVWREGHWTAKPQDRSNSSSPSGRS